jgi:hypothetical protein
MVKVADLIANVYDSVKISAMNIKNPNQTLIVYSNPKTGEYEFELPQGNYQISYESEGGEKVVRNLDLPITNPVDSFVLPGTILPKTDFTADLFVQSNKTISVTKGDSILFPLIIEPNSILTIEKWVGDSLLSTEQFLISDTIFNYKMVPSSGDNKLVFKLTDKFNNTTSTDVFITREKNVIQQPIIRPEYNRIIAKKQMAALASMLNSRSNSKLKNVIKDANIENHLFGKVDDLFTYLKEEAAKKSISPEEIDKLALRVAVMDNVLSQAAVDLMAKYTDGDLKKILSTLDIEKANLKTWTDLQKYIQDKTNGEITPEELNSIAADILSNVDPKISVINSKILAVSENSTDGAIIRESLATVDMSNIKIKEKWLKAFYYEAVKQGLTHSRMSEILVAISTMPGTKVEQFLSDLIGQAEEPLLSALKSIDLKKEKIKSPAELLLFLLNNSDKVKYPEDLIYKAIANLITDKDIPVETIKNQLKPESRNMQWIIWLLVAAGLGSLFFLFWKRRKKENIKTS